jgi:hypothetical protein
LGKIVGGVPSIEIRSATDLINQLARQPFTRL